LWQLPKAARLLRAPGRVHVTQAAISMQIRQLENETGAQLFVRAPAQGDFD
jgi:DNA-binding transcriptional LysR family regulator